MVVYSPVTGDRPASSAYAMPCGTKIAASTIPAIRSERNHGRRYEPKTATPGTHRASAPCAGAVCSFAAVPSWSR